MKIGNRRLFVIGDRVLIKQENLDERTEVGLYLPQTVIEKEEVQGGRVVLDRSRDSDSRKPRR